MASGDFNADGKPDLAFGGFYSDGVSIMVNDGAGHFPSEINYPLDAGTMVHGALGPMHAVELNRDNKLDLVIALVQNNKIAIMRGVGDGTFQAPSYLSVPVSTLFPADINEDGYVDLIVTGNVFWGTASGTFGAPTTLTIPAFISELIDMNNDGHLDLVGTAYDQLRVFLGSGDGTFSTTLGE
jgi:hypothetical protein